MAERPYIDVTARCACGDVAATARGEVLSMLLCACEDCQRSSGGGHSAAFSIEASAFTTNGPLASFSRPADSGAIFTRYFCPRCGTPIYGQSSRAERLVLVPIGLFGSDSAWFRPSQLIFARSHREWDAVAADLPQHLAYRQRTAP